MDAKIIVIIGVTIIIIASFLIFNYDQIIFIEKEKHIPLVDNCGVLPKGGIQHTIENEEVCKIRCNSQCEAIKYNYKKSVFKENKDSCNECDCFCIK